MSGESDESQNDDLMNGASTTAAPAAEPIVGLQNDINMQDIVDSEEMLDPGTTPVRLTPPAGEGIETETFNITHRSAIDGSIINPAATQPGTTMGFSPIQNTLNPVNNTPPTIGWYPRYPQDRTNPAGVLAAMPRDEDVLMSLQLLAYVSKYCNLRSYFHKSHLVPRLKIPSDLSVLTAMSPQLHAPRMMLTQTKNISSLTILTYSRLSKSSPCDTTRRTCNTGLVLSCGISVGKMTPEAA